MREYSLPCLGSNGFHRIAYTEWGDPDNPRIVICVHGLTRNRHDFDHCAARLAPALMDAAQIEPIRTFLKT